MRMDLPLTHGISLAISTAHGISNTYPTARIQKGLILLHENQELCEEAVGFGVPILKRGLQAIFPGELKLTRHDSTHGIVAQYTMNLEERIATPGSGTVQNPVLYGGKNILAAMIRQLPFLRGLLTRTSNLLRSRLSWKTIYEPTTFLSTLAVEYLVDESTGCIRVSLDQADLSHTGISEVILMNEQGAHHFNRYEDTDGNSLVGSDIGCWDQVNARQATFISDNHKLSFTLPQVAGARLYRGREQDGARLAWAGFGYSFPPTLEHLSYEITVKSLA